ncbi:bifunctional diaminohydroxyphosphoribosylaminopyrimidine deaminase/5-amino-6-(5-phosphoribosylamino)uracil reductase RibD [Oecophyllibacter saccharovorans]|uniref:bifunctional diaminohydroxyphosphoribosylaminopyrimidine deaminase/5-amino-6-(5-phosphoribosylamino)uracil reductase RibD n=1 Tax=Oecophyllibacter saccharovorans TaxID=2558360 RepID=UPI00240E15E4|nr:bifunctional diaminohydroxyphosphoribosylaminopyrimidine deaminase/5-amino-6-(5-phosphoribosylamino)uracil reductase RibD [Oecophyllibacter saccharovorans]
MPTEAQRQGVRAGFEAALAQAVEKMGATAPNPAVGCALLDEAGTLLAVGAHPAPDQPHAEVMALREAERLGVMERVRTALVTLEPCNHYGRTPPCSLRLRQSPVQTVWIGARDPNPQASGGADFLARGGRSSTPSSGSDKQVFFLEDVSEYASLAADCAALRAPFASRILRGRPWLTVKQALTAEGSMVPPPGRRTFTSSDSLKLAHRLRRATDAVVTGIGTVLADAPSFTVRHLPDHERRHPRLIVVFDRHGRLPPAWRRAREEAGFIVETCRDTAGMLALLATHEANWALVEGGPTLLQTLEAEKLWDDWLTFTVRSGQADAMSLRLQQSPQPGLLGHESPVTLLDRRLQVTPDMNFSDENGV